MAARRARRPPCPTISLRPDRAGWRRTATAFAIANAQNPPISAVTATTSGTDVWYGAGALWNSVTSPIAIATSPDSVSAPWRRDVRVGDEQRGAEQHEDQARPGERQDREAEQRADHADRAERARDHDARVEQLEAEPGEAGEEEQRDDVRVDQRRQEAA